MTVDITPDYLARTGTEDGHQSALFMYATDPRYQEKRGSNDALWRLLYAIPNGGQRTGATAARMKATGTKKGVPDICLPVARGGFYGLYIELKRPKSKGKPAGVINVDQSNWHNALEDQGYCVVIAYGWHEAVHGVNGYLAWPKTVIV